jgi:hypothetical protein
LDKSTVFPLGQANLTVLLLLLLLLGSWASMKSSPWELQLLRKQRTGELVHAAAVAAAAAGAWTTAVKEGPVAASSDLLLLLLLLLEEALRGCVRCDVTLTAALLSNDSSARARARFGLLPPPPLLLLLLLPPSCSATFTHAAVRSLFPLSLVISLTPPCFTSYS